MRYASRAIPRPGRFLYRVAIALLLALTATICKAQTIPASPGQTLSPQDLQKIKTMLPEFSKLLEKMQHDVQFPPPRTQSRLLPLLPESTTFYAAFPNYGDASRQAIAIFHQELQQNAALRDWWHQGDMATAGPKIEDFFEKLYQLSQYVGEEIVVSASSGDPHRPPSVLVLAEVRKPGLKDALVQAQKELSGKASPASLPSSLRVLDGTELPAAKETVPAPSLVILVRPDFVLAATDLPALRAFNARLDSKGRDFASTPFGQRVTRAYEGGAAVVGAVNLQKVLSQSPPEGTKNALMFKQSGFADMQYLVWGHKDFSGQSTSQIELSFNGPRHGIASWLAAPAPMGSLDFVSPKAVGVVSLLLKNPADIFDEVSALSDPSKPNALTALAQMEKGFGLNLRNDILGHLGGEVTVEGEGAVEQSPAWKLILGVNDGARLEATLDTLLTAVHMKTRSDKDQGILYHTLEIPSAQKTTEVCYAFADGYLILASSRQLVAESIALHHGGESLARSSQFLASLPSAEPLKVSALFYEDPRAMRSALQQALPQLADSLALNTANSSKVISPIVIRAYGEPEALRMESRSNGVDAAMIFFGAAIAMPNLLRARMAANESSAVADLRTVNTAQVTYSATYSQKGFARNLATLGPDPNGSNTSSFQHANLLDASLGGPTCIAGAWCTKSGYQFGLTTVCRGLSCDDYAVTATPVSTSTGTRSFCSASDGVIRAKIGPPPTSPFSASDCKRWKPLHD